VVADFSRLYDGGHGLCTGGFGVTKTRKITNALENGFQEATAEDTLRDCRMPECKGQIQYNIIMFYI